jgi:hypothetical protein
MLLHGLMADTDCHEPDIQANRKGSGESRFPLKDGRLVGSLSQIHIEPFEREVRKSAIFVHLCEYFVDFGKQRAGRQAGGFVERGGEVLREYRGAKLDDRETRGDVRVHNGFRGDVGNEVGHVLRQLPEHIPDRFRAEPRLHPQRTSQRRWRLRASREPAVSCH